MVHRVQAKFVRILSLFQIQKVQVTKVKVLVLIIDYEMNYCAHLCDSSYRYKHVLPLRIRWVLFWHFEI